MILDITKALDSEGKQFPFVLTSDGLEGESEFICSSPITVSGSYSCEQKIAHSSGACEHISCCELLKMS